MKLFDNAWVEKRNVLNELRNNNMTLQELRFFSIYLSKIDPFKIDTRCVRFPIDDFQRIMGFGKLNLSQIRLSTDSLLCKIVHIPDEKGRGVCSFQLFKECHLFQNEYGEWFMEIDAHDKALPLMFEFKNKFFKYKLWNALRLKSPNQFRMYEILKQYEDLGKRVLSVIELRELLGIDKNEYSGRTGWSNFKKYVLDSCQQALKENTDICYTYERGKTGAGGKWLTIIFYIKKNENYKDPLTLEEFIDQQPKPASLESETATEFDYDSDLSVLLDKVFKGEFPSDNIQELHDLVCKAVPENDNKARVQYFLERYRKMEAYSPNKKGRLNYLKTIIENEIQSKGDSSSYDLSDYEKFARDYDFSDAPWNVKPETEKS